MKQTSIYKLNQWEKTDRIMMEDFNGDNGKLEEALGAVNSRVDALAASKAEQSALNAEKAAREAADAALTAANCWVKLGEVVTSGAMNSVSMDLSDVDWSQYRQMEIVATMQASNASAELDLRVNGRSDAIYHRSTNTSAKDSLSLCGRGGDGCAVMVRMGTARPSGSLMGYVTYSGSDNGTLFCDSDGFMVSGVALEDVRILQFFTHSTYTLAAGSTFAVYGLKK